MNKTKHVAIVAGSVALLIVTSCQTAGTSSSAGEKRDFLALVRTLPSKGDMFTDEAFAKASPFLPVMFDLTERDLRGKDLYPLCAIIGGVCLREENRVYAVTHFPKIRHPEVQLFVGSVLFDKGWASPEIIRYLQVALEDEEQAQNLADIVGPSFETFKKQVMTQTGTMTDPTTAPTIRR